MKNVLVLIPETASPDRLAEAVRVAAGLSQNPDLRVSLKLPTTVSPHLPSAFQEYFEVFAEKGHQVYADALWRPLLPSSIQPLCLDSKIQTSSFHLFIPF